MIAAIYARKSTEQNGVSDEEKSVTRQIEHAKGSGNRARKKKSASSAPASKAEEPGRPTLTLPHEALVSLLAEILVDDYLSEAGRSTEARLISKHRKGGSHGQNHSA